MEYIYASLLLYKAGKEVNEDNLKKVLEAAGVEVDDVRVKSLVAALKNIDIAKVLEQATVAPAVAAPVVAGEAEAVEEEKKEEEKPAEEEEEKEGVSEEELAEGLGALFG
ncbi:MAG: 50S ribosomal protein P1 [Thermoprotei archaeon]|nr:MAG: 50S ribosomal protein P1 [Thermoprotei archaeon]